jgi:hypothetical protein
MNRTWILSLSVGTIVGPYEDVRHLQKNDYYKNHKNTELELQEEYFNRLHNSVIDFEKIMNINDNNFIPIIEDLSQNRGFSRRYTKLRNSLLLKNPEQLEKLCSKELDKKNKKAKFNRTLLTSYMTWPKNGLLAYDLVNAVMLLRIGKINNYIGQKDFDYWLEVIGNKMLQHYYDYDSLARDISVGLNIHLSELESEGNLLASFPINGLLLTAKESIWNHIEWPKR